MVCIKCYRLLWLLVVFFKYYIIFLLKKYFLFYFVNICFFFNFRIMCLLKKSVLGGDKEGKVELFFNGYDN